jgi:hypothetical protein
LPAASRFDPVVLVRVVQLGPPLPSPAPASRREQALRELELAIGPPDRDR